MTQRCVVFVTILKDNLILLRGRPDDLYTLSASQLTADLVVPYLAAESGSLPESN